MQYAGEDRIAPTRGEILLRPAYGDLGTQTGTGRHGDGRCSDINYEHRKRRAFLVPIPLLFRRLESRPKPDDNGTHRPGADVSNGTLAPLFWKVPPMASSNPQWRYHYTEAA